jgi:hypothetical protein
MILWQIGDHGQDHPDIENLSKVLKNSKKRIIEGYAKKYLKEKMKKVWNDERKMKKWKKTENKTNKGKDVRQGHFVHSCTHQQGQQDQRGQQDQQGQLINRPRQHRSRLPVQTQRANHDKDDIKRKKKMKKKKIKTK